MFGPPGGLYVYLIYGMHLCANVVCGPDGTGEAVLIRALSPLSGLAEMRQARPAATKERDLCSGPGKLTAALGLQHGDDGVDLLAGGPVRLELGDSPVDGARVVRGQRIGITKAAERPWRFALSGDPNVSRPVPRTTAGQE